MSVLYLHKEETVTLIWIAVKLQGHRQATATSTVEALDENKERDI